MRIPAGSLRSNIGLPYISQYVLRGCGSSVYSTLTAQPLLSAYLICAVICASVSSGRKENWPCVTRLPGLVIMVAFLDVDSLRLRDDEEEVPLAPTAHALAVTLGTKSAVSVDS